MYQGRFIFILLWITGWTSGWPSSGDPKTPPTATTVNVRDEKERFGIYEERTATFSPGDRVVMLKNENKTGARNGQIGEIRSLDDRGNITARVGGKALLFNAAGKEKQLAPDATYGYRNFTHGYTVTAHKLQGQTVDKVIYDANRPGGTRAPKEKIQAMGEMLREYKIGAVFQKEITKQGRDDR